MNPPSPPRKPISRRARKPGEGPSAFQAVSEILPQVGRAMNLDRTVREWSVLSLWQESVAPPFRTQTRAVKLLTRGQKRMMVVMAANPIVAAELSFHLEAALERMNGFAGQTGLRLDGIEIRLR